MRVCKAVLLAVVAAIAPAVALAEQASQPQAAAAGRISAGLYHSCAVVGGAARCWGFGAQGQLGYGATATVGDDERPGSAGPIDVGRWRTVVAIDAGGAHTCGLLDDATVRCWGFAGDGRLGYGNLTFIGDDEPPSAAGPVDLGPGRTARAVSAGGSSTCAVLDDGNVRCWGFGLDGRLGYGNDANIGDDETPGTVAPVDLGTGRTATTVSVGGAHACALLDDGSVRCWGFGARGALGYGSDANIGDDEKPGTVGPVDLGPGRTATALATGTTHTCALLDDGSVRCWGSSANGQLGGGSTSSVGDNETPAAVAPVNLGARRTATAIAAGSDHTCALLDDGSLRCWGAGGFGRLGLATTATIGDDETPGSVGPVDLGAGRTAVAVAGGELQTCAVLDDGAVRCWGSGANGRLGGCNDRTVGDDEAPATVDPVDLAAGPPACPQAPTPPDPMPTTTPAPTPTGTPEDNAGPSPRELERRRARALRACQRRARDRDAARRRCLRRFGRTPGRVRDLQARGASRSKVVLTFRAAGTDGADPPAARAYLVKQSLRPIRGRREFQRAPSLCGGACRFRVSAVGTRVRLSVTNLSGHRRYHYAVAARDNVSRRVGPRSAAVTARTR